MSANLTDRGIKLLYRQRGSRSRQVAHEGDDEKVIIRGPIVETYSDVATSGDGELVDEPLLDGPFEEPYQEVEEAEERDYVEDYQEGYENGYEPEPLYGANEKQGHDIGAERPVLLGSLDGDENVPYYNFQDLPLRQLSSSITSITSIDVLMSMFTNLFENDLIPQAVKEFESSRDSNTKMMYKLDVRIFESVLEQLMKDFKDILDINMSNNELCYQLKQVVGAREELNQELVQTRSELQNLKCGGEWYKLQQEQSRLSSRVELNDQLNTLNAQLHGDCPVPKPQEPLSTSETVSEFCQMVNPHSGILARIELLNKNLQQERLTE